MIHTIEIENFKSIKKLKMDCKKVNVLIGQPNTGKSNLLEGLGMFSVPHSGILKDYVRFEDMSNLFYDGDLGNPVQLMASEKGQGSKEKKTGFQMYLGYTQNKFHITFRRENGKDLRAELDWIGNFTGAIFKEFTPFKFYRFKPFQLLQPLLERINFLFPPRGDNLFELIQINKKLRSFAGDLFRNYGFKLVIRQQEKKLELQKDLEENVVLSIPYSLTSDTLQRMIFFHAILETNDNSIIILEDPEVHTFPFYTRDLAESIALDSKNNQFFVSTHNPYFLLSLIEKTPLADLSIFVVYWEDFQTKLKRLGKDEIEEILDLGADAFFNLDQFVEKS